MEDKANFVSDVAKDYHQQTLEAIRELNSTLRTLIERTTVQTYASLASIDKRLDLVSFSRAQPTDEGIDSRDMKRKEICVAAAPLSEHQEDSNGHSELSPKTSQMSQVNDIFQMFVLNSTPVNEGNQIEEQLETVPSQTYGSQELLVSEGSSESQGRVPACPPNTPINEDNQLFIEPIFISEIPSTSENHQVESDLFFDSLMVDVDQPPTASKRKKTTKKKRNHLNGEETVRKRATKRQELVPFSAGTQRGAAIRAMETVSLLYKDPFPKVQ